MTLVNVKNKKNGVTYVYESIGYWDKEKQQARSKRKCIGKIDDETGEIIYSKKYLESKELEQIKANPNNYKSDECKRTFVGATHLLDEIGSKLGIAEDLEKCFPKIHKQIQSLAYYLVMEDRNPLSRFPKWSKTHSHPFGENITSQRSSELLEMITEDKKINFFKLQSKRRLEREYLAYDTTSVSSFSKTIKQVKYGHNKENDKLPQINLALLFGEKSRLPVYYRKLAGNISDVKTINNLLADIKFLELKNVKLVMDRGFYKKDNIDALYKNKYKFLIAAKTSLKFVEEKLKEVREKMTTRPFFISDYNIYATSYNVKWDYTEVKRSGEEIKKDKRMYMHIYYNDQRATDDRITFNGYLDLLEKEILTSNRIIQNMKKHMINILK